jgi:hypothetical protein
LGDNDIHQIWPTLGGRSCQPFSTDSIAYPCGCFVSSDLDYHRSFIRCHVYYFEKEKVNSLMDQGFGGSLKSKFMSIIMTGIDEPICMIVVNGGETKYYYHFDGLGSVIALSNVNSDIVEWYSYDVFSEPDRTSDVNNPYFFTGRS